MSQQHYKTNKKEYYINLRSTDATIETSGVNNTKKFSWNIQNINVSQQAKIGITQICSEFITYNANPLPYIIKCAQVKNDQYDSTGGASGALIYCGANLENPKIENMYHLATRNVDRIDLQISESITNLSHGIRNTINFYIQLKVVDFDTEEVDKSLMPTYTNKSLSFHYPNGSV